MVICGNLTHAFAVDMLLAIACSDALECTTAQRLYPRALFVWTFLT